ncbi:MAG: hybrid sensor histidine kinase/response regulator, partial [Hyphomonadaceae bacterium]
MTDETSDIVQKRGADVPQIAFWAAVALGLMAAGVAVTAGEAVGRAGAILLILLAAAGLVLFFFMSRGPGRRLGAFPDRGALEVATFTGAKTDLVLLDALEEAALITDRELSPIAANAAYIAVAETAGALGDSDRPPAMARLFGADPMLSAPMFRLARAAGACQSRRETLPPTNLGGGQTLYEASVGPMAGGRILWRLRELALNTQADPENRQLFLDDAPIGFFVAREDGQIGYMNSALRAVLGVGGDPGRLRVKDLVKDESGRFLKRDRRGFGAVQTPVMLRCRDGVERPANALTYWGAANDRDARTLIFFTDAETPGASAQAREARILGPTDALFEH